MSIINRCGNPDGYLIEKINIMENKKAEQRISLVDLSGKTPELETLFKQIDLTSLSRGDLAKQEQTSYGKVKAKLAKGWHVADIRDQALSLAHDEETGKARVTEIRKQEVTLRRSPSDIEAIEESLNDTDMRERFDNIDGINPDERLTIQAVGITPQDDSKSIVRNLQGMLVAIATLQEAENGEVEILPDVEYYGEIPLPKNIWEALPATKRNMHESGVHSVIDAIWVAENMSLELAPLKIGGGEYKSGTLLSIRTDRKVSIDIILSAQKVTMPECASQMIHKKQGRFAEVIEDMKKTQREEDKARAAEEKLEEKKNKLTTFVIELPVKQVPIYFEQYTGNKAGRKKEQTLRNALSANEALFTDVNSRSKSDTYKAVGRAVKALIKE